MMRAVHGVALIFVAALGPACGGVPDEPSVADAAFATAEPRVRVPETFFARFDSLHELHAILTWTDAEGALRLFAVARDAGQLLALDPVTGDRVASTTRGYAGVLDEPVALATHGDVLFVAERGARRVQTFRLPDLTPLGSFTDTALVAPRAMALIGHAASADVYVADAVRDAPVASRIHIFRVSYDARGRPRAERMRAFERTRNDAPLGDVSDVAVDAVHGRLLVADRTGGAVHVFSLAGDVTGEVLAAQDLQGEPTGVDLYVCGLMGHWAVATRDGAGSTFHLIDRATLEPAGSFAGHIVARAGRIAVSNRRSASFEAGAFYAIDDSLALAAFAWDAIRSAVPAGLACPNGILR